jgi:hypothetical protein
MRQFLNCSDWTPVISDCTATYFDKFAKIMQDASEICCPMTTKTLSSKPREPWFLKGLLVSQGTKESLHRQARKSIKFSMLNAKAMDV